MDQMLSWVLVHHCITRPRREGRDDLPTLPPRERPGGWIGGLRALFSRPGLSR